MKLTVGNKIREARIRKGLTQTDLANGLVTPSMISQIEADKATPSYQLLQGIAERLDTPIESFITDFGNQTRQYSAFQLAKAYLAAKMSDDAIELLQNLPGESTLFLSDTETEYQLALAYIQKKDWQHAQQLLESVLEHAVQRSDIFLIIQCYESLGRIGFELQEYRIAIHHWLLGYRQALEFERADPFQIGRFAQCLSTAYEKLGQAEEAKRFLLDSMHRLEAPGLTTFTTTYRDLARQCYLQGDYELALHYASYSSSLDQYANVTDSYVQAQIQYAKSIYLTGQANKAFSILKQCENHAVEHNNKTILCKIYLAWIDLYFQSGQHEDALRYCELIQKIVQKGTEEQADCLFRMAQIMERRNDGDQATHSYKRAAELYEQNHLFDQAVQCYLQLGTILNEKGEVKAATDYLEKMRDALEHSLQQQNIVMPPKIE